MAEAVNVLARLDNKHFPLPNYEELQIIYDNLNEYCHPEDVIADILSDDNYREHENLYLQPISNLLECDAFTGAVKADGIVMDFWEGLCERLSDEGMSDNDVHTYLNKVNEITAFLRNSLRGLKSDLGSIGVGIQQGIKNNYPAELLNLFRNHVELLNELKGLPDRDKAKKIKAWAKKQDERGRTLIENPSDNNRAKFARLLKEAGFLSLSERTFRDYL